jgi:hypothetical protein
VIFYHRRWPDRPDGLSVHMYRCPVHGMFRLTKDGLKPEIENSLRGLFVFAAFVVTSLDADLAVVEARATRHAPLSFLWVQPDLDHCPDKPRSRHVSVSSLWLAMGGTLPRPFAALGRMSYGGSVAV